MRQDSIELEDIPEDGKPPARRIKGAREAAQIVWRLVDCNRLRALSDALVKGTLDGNPPYAPEELKKHGQSYRANVNFREAEGLRDAAVTPYYDLFAEAPYYAEVRLDADWDWKAVDNSRIVTEEWNQMLRNWDGFDFNIQMTVSDLVTFGRGFCIWEDEENWQFSWIKYSKVLVPDGTTNNVKDVELLIIRQQYTLSQLWEKIKDKKTARQMGWNPAACSKAMTRAVPDLQSVNIGDDYEYWQERLRNNDLYEATGNKVVRAAHVLVREYSGKISHMIVEEVGSKADGETERDFLYEKKDRFKSLREFIGSFFYDLGDGTWHSVKGLLVKMNPFIQLKNRTNCAAIDNFFLTMSVLVKATSGKTAQNPNLMQVGPLSILPPDTEVQQWGLAGRMQEGLMIDNHLERKLSANIGTYRQSVRREQGNPETATKVMADQAKEAMLSKGAVNRFYGQLDHVFVETYNRSLNTGNGDTEWGKAAAEFRERCEKRGVMLGDLKKVRFVRAYRNIGNGSIFQRQQSMLNMLAVVPMLNEAGRQNWLDDYIASSTNQEMVDRYNPKGNYNPTLEDDRVTATLQVAAAKEGVAPVITDTQNHVIYADIFLAAAADSIQSVGQGADPMQVLSFLETLGPALAQHMSAIAADKSRQQVFDALEPRYKQVAQFTDRLKAQVIQMQQQQAKQAQKQQRFMTDQQMAEAKTASDIQRKDRKAAFDMSIKGRKAEQQIAIQDVTTATSEQRENVKLANDIRRQNTVDRNGG